MSTHNIPFSIYKKKIILNNHISAATGFCSKGLKNEFETALGNKPSVFQPLKGGGAMLRGKLPVPGHLTYLA